MGKLRVEVVLARPDAADRVALELEAGATARDALQASGLVARHPELGSGAVPLGIFGRRVRAETPLNDGDRIEIYRPLVADPKDARRRRAKRRR